MLGGAGTGRTTIAEAIGDVFAKAGMFVGNNLIQAGRGDLVGQYMGETVIKTREFLIKNLDNGVIFIDEAYAITPWEDGKPENYGTEAATAMVEFMTKYTGLYCIITAGYEKEMTRYFLPSNEGLDRRFPHKFLLRTMTSDEMLVVFKRQLLRAQGIPMFSSKRLASEQYFSSEAFDYLRKMIELCLQGDVSFREEVDASTKKTYKRVIHFSPHWEYMYHVFEHQAGSMANLADEAITILYKKIKWSDVVSSQKKRGRNGRPAIRQQGVETMQHIITQRIRNMALSDAEAYIKQMNQMQTSILIRS